MESERLDALRRVIRPGDEATEAAALAPRSGQRMISFYGDRPRKKAHGVDQLSINSSANFSIAAAPIEDLVYVTHPLDERRLIPFADFDEELARNKLQESLRVFNALGASRIVARANRGNATRVGGHVTRRRVQANVRGGKTSSWELAYDQRGKGGSAIDPRPIKYSDIPGLDAACEAVLRTGGQYFKIEISTHTIFGLQGDLAVKLHKAGFGLSLGAERSHYNQFIIEAAFGAQAAEALDSVVRAVTADPLARSNRFARWIKQV